MCECECMRESAVLIPGQFFRGVPAQASASCGPGECWSKARTEHESDRKQIESEPAAINHCGGVRPSHSSRMHAQKTRTVGNETWQPERKALLLCPRGKDGRKITLLLLSPTTSSCSLFLPLRPPAVLRALHPVGIPAHWTKGPKRTTDTCGDNRRLPVSILPDAKTSAALI